MLSKILDGLMLARHAVAITLVTGAATAMVAGSLDVASAQSTATTTASSMTTTTASKNTTSNELEALLRACLATKDAQSAECAQAIEKSGKDAPEFWPYVALSLNDQLRRATSEHVTTTPKPEPTKKPETTGTSTASGQLIYLVAACVESHERSSAMCQAALEASGLTADDFFAKVAIRFGKTTEPTTKPSDKPTTTTGNTEGLSILIGDCLSKYEAARKSNATGGATGEAASEACKKAIEASGLSSNDFWARFGPKTTKTTEPTRKPEPTTKPTTTQTSPTGVQTVSDEQLAAMVKDCFAKYLVAKETKEGGTAAYEACTKAITASGLGGDAFWKKFGTPGAATN